MCSRFNYIGSATLSIIAGIILGVLFFMGFITGINIVLWVFLGLAILNYIIFLIISSIENEQIKECKCKYIPGIFVGIFGTILLTIVSFGIGLSISSVVSAIVIAIFGFLASFMIINIFLFFMCINEKSGCNCGCNLNCNCNCM